MRLDIFGRLGLEMTRVGNHWIAHYLGADGKKRPADDMRIPDHLGEDEIVEFIADIFHEWATPGRYRIVRK